MHVVESISWLPLGTHDSGCAVGFQVVMLSVSAPKGCETSHTTRTLRQSEIELENESVST